MFSFWLPPPSFAWSFISISFEDSLFPLHLNTTMHTVIATINTITTAAARNATVKIGNSLDSNWMVVDMAEDIVVKRGMIEFTLVVDVSVGLASWDVAVINSKVDTYAVVGVMQPTIGMLSHFPAIQTSSVQWFRSSHSSLCEQTMQLTEPSQRPPFSHKVPDGLKLGSGQ